jgi:hypothetical protein
MRKALAVAALAAVVIALGTPQATAVTGPFYGMGFQWLRDADGDGIPNHLDDDWAPPLDGTGYKLKHGGPAAAVVGNPAGPSAEGDRLRDRDRDRDRDRRHDGTCERIRLRLRDGSCD